MNILSIRTMIIRIFFCLLALQVTDMQRLTAGRWWENLIGYVSWVLPLPGETEDNNGSNFLRRDIMAARKPQYPIDSLFINRWSPRAMSGAAITDEELMTLFEAAKWAPSSYNNQPWRFVYARRQTMHWERLFNLLVPFNQTWVKNAAVLMVMISRMTFDHNGKPSKTHSFDTGAAWENLALQGMLNGLVVHGMSGFDYDKAKRDLNVPDGYQVEAMIAIGKPGKKEDLPLGLQEWEKPSDRKKLKEIVFEGTFGA